MSRILIGWEVGAGSGHARKLTDIAARLAQRGHEPVCAVPTLAGAPRGVTLWQAPLWPAQLTQSARRSTVTPATMGDILVALGLLQEGALEGQLRAWDALLAAVKPDAVLAEYAPALTLAARGRMPRVTLGTGFSLPPAAIDRFPSLTGAPAVHDEARVLDHVNRALAAAGNVPIAHLPEIFGGEARVAATFRELDPYRGLRPEPLAPPHAPVVAPVEPPGDEIFVYMGGSQAFQPGFWRELAGRGLPIRMHDGRLGEADIALMERSGIAMERRPLPFDRIVRRSRLLISYGSLGFASAALIAGLPQVVIPYDIEKAMIAASLAEIGAARVATGTTSGGPALLDLVESAYRDAALLAHVRALSPGFRARMTSGANEIAIAAAESLIG